MTIGENIKAMRKLSSLTQKQLAEKCGLAEITIRQYESGKREPKIETILKISKALDVPITELTNVSALFKDMVDSSLGAETEAIGAAKALAKALANNDMKNEDIFRRNVLIGNYEKLNRNGKLKAIHYVEDLTKIPEYKREKKEE